jgi:hypothetical protein
MPNEFAQKLFTFRFQSGVVWIRAQGRLIMDFLKKLFAPRQIHKKEYYTFTVKCKRCGETITGRIDIDNDLSVEYEAGGDVFYARKVLIGENKCFQRVEANFKFDANRKMIEQEVIGGEFVE